VVITATIPLPECEAREHNRTAVSLWFSGCSSLHRISIMGVLSRYYHLFNQIFTSRCDTDPSQPTTLNKVTTSIERPARDRPQNPLAMPPTTPLASILGPDGQLTQLERQHRMSLGLCLHCGQTGHLARACPKQLQRNPGTIEAHTALVNAGSSLMESPKNESVVVLPGEPTA